VLRQTCAGAIPIDLLPDLLEVTKEHRRILHVSVLAIAGISSHISLTVKVLTLQRSLDFAPHDVYVALVMVMFVGEAAASSVTTVMSAEPCGFGADLGADVLV